MTVEEALKKILVEEDGLTKEEVDKVITKLKEHAVGMNDHNVWEQDSEKYKLGLIPVLYDLSYTYIE